VRVERNQQSTMNMKASTRSAPKSGARVTVSLLCIGGAAAVAAGWIAANAGMMIDGALLVAAPAALGGVVAAMIAHAAIRKQNVILHNQAQLAQSVEQAGVSIIREGADGAVTFVSGAESSQEADSVERFLGSPDDRVLADCRARAKDGVAAELMWAAKANPARRYEVSARPEPDGGVFWILRDARGSLAGQLSEDVDNFCATLDFGTDGLFVLDAGGRFVFANEILASWLGKSPEDLSVRPKT
jgi:PAS domain-containing protein